MTFAIELQTRSFISLQLDFTRPHIVFIEVIFSDCPRLSGSDAKLQREWCDGGWVGASIGTGEKSIAFPTQSPSLSFLRCAPPSESLGRAIPD